MKPIVVVGRGHSGTRLLAHTLIASNVFMGHNINRSGDLIPPDDMYEACRIFGMFIPDYEDGPSWNFENVINADPPPGAKVKIRSYLHNVIVQSAYGPSGWKLPETTLILPWIVKLFPDGYYIYLVRHPLDCIRAEHYTDDMALFNVWVPPTDSIHERRAFSWLYQYRLVEATPKPERWLQIRFEDFVLDQGKVIYALEQFLGMDVAWAITKKDAANRWKDGSVPMYDFLEEPMTALGYSWRDDNGIPLQYGSDTRSIR